MNKHNALSSGQALDDYFEALLDDLDETPEPHQDTVAEVSVRQSDSESSRQKTATPLDPDYQLEPQPKLAPDETDVEPVAFAEPERDLAEVERLLAQLKVDEEAELAQAEAEVEPQVETTTETDTPDVDTVVEPDLEVTTDTDIESDIEVSTETLLDEPIVETEVTEEVAVETEQALDLDAEIMTEPQTDLEADVATDTELETEVDLETEVEIEQTVDVDSAVEPETQAGEDLPPTQWENVETASEFQVLFFESMGVTYAVPLAELGGIHQLGDCNHLIGRPDWYLGLQTEKHQQLDVVDTARWVMPEKLADNSHRDDYNYIVLLGDSKWGLACNRLLGTQALSGKAIRWRKQAGKRPWLAGMVKEKMCALIHVQAFIAMLNQGIDAKAMA
ncbi:MULTISPECIES: chemotaxis protein CheW [unclassified Salinivibrio]|uniref:chemotaxis protein CheW n=1 Tax=unclassified Salinivibrio TaxID=2636825 RepID=UPI000987C423|nr:MULTISPECIES: chemotaxis protein CheW [unclassified Salinivibrio]OOF15747.1 chemotaxis protein CheW [Salinivibrio sp. PR919]OOF19552.1 chemotaxis protein CheW [Salinivibrio sp. PR932]